MPESISTFTVWALAISEKCFGLGEDIVQTDLVFQVESRFPSFLNVGDVCQMGVMLSNKQKTKKKVRIVVEFFGGQIELVEPNKEILVNLPPGIKQLVNFPVKASAVGDCAVRVFARDCDSSDCDSFEEKLTVIVPKVSESFADYGETAAVEETISRKVSIPIESVYKCMGGVSLSFASTGVSQLTDAFLYLYNYKFNCSEQISSKVIGCLTVGPILNAFNVAGCPSQSLIDDVINNALEKYKSSQKEDGGFGYWSSSVYYNPYVSSYVALCLALVAQSKRYNVDSTMLEKSKNFNLKMANWSLDCLKKEDFYCVRMERGMRCYALSVCIRLFDGGVSFSDNEKLSLVETASSVYKLDEDETDITQKLGVDSLALILFSICKFSKEGKSHPISKKIIQKLLNSLNETSATANFITKFSREESSVLLCSDTKTDAIILEVLCDLMPKEFIPIIPKIVKGILGHRSNGKSWSNTQENCYVLIALKKYFDVFEKDVPNMKINFTYSKDISGSTTFKGRDTKTESFIVPTKELVAKADISFQKVGSGRLYYRIGFEYTPIDLRVDSKDRGFKVTQTMEWISSKSDCIVEKDGSYTVKNGELVRIRATVFTETKRYHTALVISAPSGFEILNPNLKTTGEIPTDSFRGQSQKHLNPEYINYRKDCVEAFNSSLYAGKYHFSFVARAIHVGKYFLTPASVEEMYSPDIFGRAQTNIIVVK